MPVLKPRTKLIYFRVSQEEFEQFNRACEMEGARSLSDLARTAMTRTIHREGKDEIDASQIKKLEGLIGELSSSVRMLATLIQDQTEIKGSEPLPSASEKGKVHAKSA